MHLVGLCESCCHSLCYFRNLLSFMLRDREKKEEMFPFRLNAEAFEDNEELNSQHPPPAVMDFWVRGDGSNH